MGQAVGGRVGSSLEMERGGGREGALGTGEPPRSHTGQWQPSELELHIQGQGQMPLECWVLEVAAAAVLCCAISKPPGTLLPLPL